MQRQQLDQKTNMRGQKRGNKRSASKVFIVISLLLITLYGTNSLLKQYEKPSSAHLPIVSVTPSPAVIKYESEPVLNINSTNAILIRLGSDNEALFEIKSADQIYPASLTKIMTAIVALENLQDFNQNIVLSDQMYATVYTSNAAVAGFLPKEEVRAIDLLYGLLLPSGAECAIGLAEYVAGSEIKFADLMNKKAKELGLDGTYFVNATGLHDTKHYSTVKDIATLLAYALNNDVFYEIFTSARHSTKPTNLHPDGITFYSTLFSKMESAKFLDGIILGGKTGYTDEAGQCLASLAEKNGERLILVTCGAQGDRQTQMLHIDDAFTIYAAIH